MERPVFQPAGTPVQDLDTPALVVDLGVMERNIEVLHAFFRQASAAVRPHVTSHQCPHIAHRQMASGGTVGGIAVTKVGEAEVFSSAGFNDVLVANEIVTPPKVRRLCSLAQRHHITVAVDNPQNVEDLSKAASASNVTLHVLVEVDAGAGRCGVSPGAAALDLARKVARAPGLRFQGLMAYEGNLLYQLAQDPREKIPPDPPLGSGEWRTRLEVETHRRLQPVVDTRELMERAGLPVSVVSVGGTHNYDIAGKMSGVTEVQAGSYPLMDYHYCQYRTEFSPAGKVLATVISHPIERLAVVDAGHKATGPDRGAPVLEGFPGARATRFSAEHGIIELESASGQPGVGGWAPLQPGDKVWLVPFDLELCINQYNYIRAVRDGKLEGFWPIAARGRSD